ncbi:MAG: hypothetical protein IKU46_02425 [Peptococcaceae bacterium]|nr:hypothetical protein [Peptococcaceae bacterium]
MEQELFDLVKKIRLHINNIHKQAALMEKLEKWFRITSALDVVEDTACAIGFYQEQPYPSELGGQYLYTYGVLQALFMQQDAVESINAVLRNTKSIDWKTDYPDAYKVREFRNDVVGHPTNRSEKWFMHLAQISLQKESFWYSKASTKTEESKHISVDVLKAINDVQKCNKEVLEKVVEEMDRDFKAYIEKHKDRKMTEIFDSLDYAIQNIVENSHSKDHYYNRTKQMVKECEEELVLRYGAVENVDPYNYLLKEIHEIYKLLDEGLSKVPSDFSGGIEKYLLQCLFYKLDELKDYCKETDEYFENYGKTIINEKADIEITFVEDFLED